MNFMIIGTYRSGSSLLAGMLDGLGVDMGGPFHGSFFEPADLSRELRRWWREPELVESVPPDDRLRYLRDWMAGRENVAANGHHAVGAKHPLLTLSAGDVMRAWGEDTRVIWTDRPLDQSIASLRKLGWFPEPARMQQKIHDAADAFFDARRHLRIDYQDVLKHPEAQWRRVVDYLQLSVTEMQMADATRLVRRPLRGSTSGDRKPKIVGTMLSGNSEHHVAAAAESVLSMIDELVLIDTGITDGTARVLSKIAGDRLHIVSHAWTDDFAGARNESLRIADRRDATWAMTIDTDERMQFDDLHDRDGLLEALHADASVSTWMVMQRDGSYSKERFIRLPTDLRWSGRTHESLIGPSLAKRRVLPGVRFWEEPKTAGAMRRKLLRDLPILLDTTNQKPTDARWWYYLGQTYAAMDLPVHAEHAFGRCVALDGWAEQQAFARYRLAKSIADQGRYRDAVHQCGIGLADHPDSPELAWMAAWCHYKLGSDDAAITWANVAIKLGSYQGMGAAEGRVAFRQTTTWYEGPYDILRFSLRRLGREREADQAEADYRAANMRRELILNRIGGIARNNWAAATNDP